MNEDNRVNSALNYLSGVQGLNNVSEVDNDMYSLLMFNSDLMPFDDQNLFPEEDADSSNSDEPEKKKKKKSNAKMKTEKKSNKRSRAPLTKEEKESKRKANRINSRKFRLRQRQKIENLEKEVKKLKEQNRQLQLGVHLARQNNETGVVGDDKMELDDMTIDAASGDVEIPSPSLPVSALRQSHIRDLGDLILMKRQNKETTEKIKNIVKEHVEYFSDAGRTRKRLLKYHVSMLKKLMLPTQVTKLCVWGLQQDDEFFEDNKQSSEDEAKPFTLDQESEEPSLWQIICDKLNLTDEQKAGIMENRKHVGAQRRNISETMKLMAKVESKIEDTVKMNYNTLQSIMGVLTPLQQAKYLVWQEDNAACMQMLEHLWRSMVK